MCIRDRIKAIRQSLNLTLEKFGQQLGVTKVAVYNIEKANRNVTEQMRKAICREFNVNYNWLVSGEGDMFNQTDETISDSIDRIMAGENEFHKNLFKTLDVYKRQCLHHPTIYSHIQILLYLTFLPFFDT